MVVTSRCTYIKLDIRCIRSRVTDVSYLSENYNAAISCGNLYVLIRGVFDRPTAFSLNDYLKTTLYPAFAHTGLASNVTLRDFYLAFISRSSRSINKIRVYTP